MKDVKEFEIRKGKTIDTRAYERAREKLNNALKECIGYKDIEKIIKLKKRFIIALNQILRKMKKGLKE